MHIFVQIQIKFEFQLCCLMTPGLNKDIQCHVWPYSFSVLANHQIRRQATHKVGRQPSDCRFPLTLHRWFVCVPMG